MMDYKFYMHIMEIETIFINYKKIKKSKIMIKS